ncbi:protein kintoun-like [Tubulanus polymorphus]|uniref:protein kintoun-like n=1 Tax=Tubulanus polymorphus TaxID=672921 RepID=UPI003DA5F2EF
MASTQSMPNNEKPFSNLEKLDLSSGEIQKLTDAFKNEEFRKLFAEYAEEISDPVNKRKYEEEIAEMERDRGMDVKFIHPDPCYVLKCNDGTQKIFINICRNKDIDKPTASKQRDPKGNYGLQWSVPHSFAPPREDLDSSNQKCQVIDIVFNPDVMRMAESNASFKKMCEDIAIEGIQRQFGIKLDPKNVKSPKMKYKGTPQATVIRSRSANGEVNADPEPTAKKDNLFPYPYDELTTAEKAAKREETEKIKGNTETSKENGGAITPKYSIVHRSGIEMHEFCNEPLGKRDIRPKELVVYIELPLLKSAAGVDLDIFEKRLVLEIESPAWYKLDLKLPYAIDENSGTAKFDKSKKRLAVTLPVIPLSNHDLSSSSTAETNSDEAIVQDQPVPAPLIEVLSSSEQVSEPSPAPVSRINGTTENEIVAEKSNLTTIESHAPATSKDIWGDADVSSTAVIRYSFPGFDCNQDLQTVSYVLHVKNVDRDSVTKTFDQTEKRSTITIKFVSIGSGGFPVYYSFCARFAENCRVVPDQCSVDLSNENVAVLLLKDRNCRNTWNSYEVGSNLDKLEEKLFLTDASLSKSLDELEADAKQHSQSTKDNVTLPHLHVTKMNEKKLTFRIGSQSDDDVLDDPESPIKSPDIQVIHDKKSPSLHGILKPRSLSMSESSDEANAQGNKYVRSQSMPSYSSDSPRTGNESDECGIRKSVSFNDHIDTTRFKPNAAVNSMKTTLKSKRRRMRKREAKISGRQRRHSSSEYSSDDHGDDNNANQAASDSEKDDTFLPDERTSDINSACSFDTIHEASPVPGKPAAVDELSTKVENCATTKMDESRRVDESMVDADETSKFEEENNAKNTGKKPNKRSKSKRKKATCNNNNNLTAPNDKPSDEVDSDDKSNVDEPSADNTEQVNNTAERIKTSEVETMLSWDEPTPVEKMECPIEFSNSIMFDLDTDI